MAQNGLLFTYRYARKICEVILIRNAHLSHYGYRGYFTGRFTLEKTFEKVYKLALAFYVP